MHACMHHLGNIIVRSCSYVVCQWEKQKKKDWLLCLLKLWYCFSLTSKMSSFRWRILILLSCFLLYTESVISRISSIFFFLSLSLSFLILVFCQYAYIVPCRASRNNFKIDGDERWARYWMTETKGWDSIHIIHKPKQQHCFF